MSDATRLYLVRHGETAWSISGQHTGLTDIALTAHGEDQARALAPYFAKIRFAKVFSSPLMRARRTCELAGLGAAAQNESDLVEWNYGDYEGRRSADIVKERPGWSVWADGCPHGETPAMVSERADRLLIRLRAIPGNVAVFSHGQFGSALAARWIGLPVGQGQHLELSPATVSTLSVARDHPDIPVISLWNSAPPVLVGRG
jgi:broad specificity phosphatase PhoE